MTTHSTHLTDREAMGTWYGSKDYRGQDTVRVIQVVETTLTRRGSGKSDADPIRIVTQYWSLDGELLAEVDPYVAS